MTVESCLEDRGGCGKGGLKSDFEICSIRTKLHCLEHVDIVMACRIQLIRVIDRNCQVREMNYCIKRVSTVNYFRWFVMVEYEITTAYPCSIPV